MSRFFELKGKALARLVLGLLAGSAGGGALAQQVQLQQVTVTSNQPTSQPSPGALPTFVRETEALDQARQDIYAPIGANSYQIDQKTIDALPAGENTPLDKVLLQLPGVSQGFSGERRSSYPQ